MHYIKYCDFNNIDPLDERSAKMYYFYKEAEAASTDIRKATRPMNNTEKCKNIFKKKCSPTLSDILAPLPKAVPQPCQVTDIWLNECCVQQEGKTPMRYNELSATATVSSQPSDSSVAREHLLGRLRDADYAKRQELEKLFNLYGDNTPKTYKEMIDVIKAGTYTIDPKIAKRLDAAEADEDDYCNCGPLYGIVWPGPKNDHEGYNEAIKLKEKQRTAVKDVIMTDTAAEGLKALQAFEAWLPAVDPVATH